MKSKNEVLEARAVNRMKSMTDDFIEFMEQEPEVDSDDSLELIDGILGCHKMVEEELLATRPVRESIAESKARLLKAAHELKHPKVFDKVKNSHIYRQ